MIAPSENIDVLLPYGDMLRMFIEQPFISKGDLRSALRARGIIVGSLSKEDTIPIAVCCLFSPREFGHLKECQSTKEDNLKSIARHLEWNSPDTLISSMPTNLDLNGLLGEATPYCQMLGNPTFVPVGNNPDHVRLDFEVERQDLSKSWARTKDIFKGSISVEKIQQGKTAKLLITYTANETKLLGLNATKTLKQHLETGGHLVSGSNEMRILFSDFTNAQRVKFFLSLTGDNKTNFLHFKDVVDCDVSPDGESGALPDEIKWMEKKVDEFKLKGKNLHETIFIKEEKYHPHLHLHRMEAKFEFAYHAAAGTCTICFAFEGFLGSPGKSAEFEMNISALSIKSDDQTANRTSVKEQILRAIESFTLEQYTNIRKSP